MQAAASVRAGECGGSTLGRKAACTLEQCTLEPCPPPTSTRCTHSLMAWRTSLPSAKAGAAAASAGSATSAESAALRSGAREAATPVLTTRLGSPSGAVRDRDLPPRDSPAGHGLALGLLGAHDRDSPGAAGGSGGAGRLLEGGGGGQLHGCWRGWSAVGGGVWFRGVSAGAPRLSTAMQCYRWRAGAAIAARSAPGRPSWADHLRVRGSSCTMCRSAELGVLTEPW